MKTLVEELESNRVMIDNKNKQGLSAKIKLNIKDVKLEIVFKLQKLSPHRIYKEKLLISMVIFVSSIVLYGVLIKSFRQ